MIFCEAIAPIVETKTNLKLGAHNRLVTSTTWITIAAFGRWSWSVITPTPSHTLLKKRVAYETPKVLEFNIIPFERLSEQEKRSFRFFQKSFRITQFLDDNIGFRRKT